MFIKKSMSMMMIGLSILACSAVFNMASANPAAARVMSRPQSSMRTIATKPARIYQQGSPRWIKGEIMQNPIPTINYARQILRGSGYHQQHKTTRDIQKNGETIVVNRYVFTNAEGKKIVVRTATAWGSPVSFKVKIKQHHV